MKTGPNYDEQIDAIRKLDEKTVHRAFAKACKMSGININEPNMKPKNYHPKKVLSVEIKKHYASNASSINESHYTKLGEHPEDRIYRDKEYINRLQKHIDYVYEVLDKDLRLNEKGHDWLFDYVFNEDDKNIEFEEYLAKYNVKYADCVTSNKSYHNK
jgi:hypothetical protein